MIQESKTISIKDLENTINFRIKLFSALEGLDFLDEVLKTFNSNNNFSIKPYLSDLLKLACPINDNGQPMFDNDFNLSLADSIFKNPLSLIELAQEVFDFQQVFIKSSSKYHDLMNILQNKLNIKI